MDFAQIISTSVTVIIPIGGLMAWIYTRIDKRFDFIDKRFDSIESELKEIKSSIHSVDIRVGRLETQDEERFRNEIKLLVSERRKGE